VNDVSRDYGLNLNAMEELVRLSMIALNLLYLTLAIENGSQFIKLDQTLY
jgi:hypothetical protein